MRTKRRFVVIGAGGQARETSALINDLAALGERVSFLGYVVSDLGRLGTHDSREAILGDYEWLSTHRGDFDALALGVGSPESRARIFDDLQQDFPPDYWPFLKHPSASVDTETCKIGFGVLVGVGAIATVNVVFAPLSMANFGCTIGHEAMIGRASVVSPGANISGGVVLGERVLVGTGAQILQYITVGAEAKIGAGAVVTKNVAAGVTVVGVPARPQGLDS